MGFQPHPDRVTWRLHLATSPQGVYDALNSDEGRASFWAESAAESEGVIHFQFINGEQFPGRVLRRTKPTLWSVEYLGSVVEFHLEPDGRSGTDLTMHDVGVAPQHRDEVTAGWLNVLLPMKAALDHGIDLHSHDPARSWDQGYVDH